MCSTSCGTDYSAIRLFVLGSWIMTDERDSRGKIILKSKFENILYWIIICGTWGLLLFL